MRRREFITLIGGAAATWPIRARAQQTAIPVIGFLGGGTAEAYAGIVAAIREGLGQSGFTDGKEIAIEYRWAEGRYDQLPTFAADLVRRRVSVIVTTGGSAPAQAAKTATASILPTRGDPQPRSMDRRARRRDRQAASSLSHSAQRAEVRSGPRPHIPATIGAHPSPGTAPRQHRLSGMQGQG